MDCKLIWTESAIEDLGAIVRYVSLRSDPEVAREVGLGIYDRAQILKQFPQAGTIIPEKEDSRWRKLIFKSWKIAYKVDFEMKTVYLARIWHASRDEIEIK